MEFHDFPRTHGKSGKYEIYPPNLCASLIRSMIARDTLLYHKILHQRLRQIFRALRRTICIKEVSISVFLKPWILFVMDYGVGVFWAMYYVSGEHHQERDSSMFDDFPILVQRMGTPLLLQCTCAFDLANSSELCPSKTHKALPKNQWQRCPFCQKSDDFPVSHCV